MKTLCLNYRGLRRSEAVQEIRSLIQLHRPCLVFLSEMRLFFDHVDGLKRSLGMPHGLGWEATGGEEAWRSSGLEMLM
jgi:hypothetical protein